MAEQAPGPGGASGRVGRRSTVPGVCRPSERQMGPDLPAWESEKSQESVAGPTPLWGHRR